jgi:hypothetical protein
MIFLPKTMALHFRNLLGKKTKTVLETKNKIEEKKTNLYRI